MNGVNPQVYFTDLITRLVNGWPQKPQEAEGLSVIERCQLCEGAVFPELPGADASST